MSAFPTPQSSRDDDSVAPQQAALNFDLTLWHVHHQACRTYFVEEGQYKEAAKALAAFLNIRLPHQIPGTPLRQQFFSTTSQLPWAGPDEDIRRKAQASLSFNGPDHHRSPNPLTDAYTDISLFPYLKRLVCTGFDKDSVMLELFGEHWMQGIKRLLDQERKNFLFAVRSKGSSWLKVKEVYDAGMGPNELVPFLKPLGEAEDGASERGQADMEWKQWEEFEAWEAPGSNARGKRRANEY
ncbi:hypothetical protein BJ508DRAFT_332025 [Ascobolus immersus RN42]|uniref:Uncharacterized protein n=1 Tax=Ascobolus immersus RN42 TaxID=1160509 RepID=A0A3N4HR97_ASCIM|nr:hypothetical protein BJ508DRAFT_332025 [Ascobolus immersus RN42]